MTSDDGTDLLLHDTRWNNGHRDVRVAERNETPPPYDTVVGRLRISVDPIEEDLFMELRQARIKRNGRAQVADATWEELDEGAGTSVSRALRDLGAPSRHQRSSARSEGPNAPPHVLPLSTDGRAGSGGRARA